VRGQQDGLAKGAQVVDEGPRPPAGRRIESRRGLVEEDEIGIPDDPQPQVEASPLTPGEGLHAGIGLPAEADEIDHLTDGERPRVHRCEQRQRLANGELPVHPRRLEHDADPRPEVGARLRWVDPEHSDLPGRPLQEALQDLHGGRLSGAVRSEQGEYLAGLDGQVDAANRLDRAVMLDESPDPYGRHERGA
jgi:hypothetical protein